eukprot:EG_transcript_16184
MPAAPSPAGYSGHPLLLSSLACAAFAALFLSLSTSNGSSLPELLATRSAALQSIATADWLAWQYDGPALITTPSVSGINTLPPAQQQLCFVAAMTVILAGMVVVKKLFFPVAAALLPHGWYRTWTGTFPLLGALYAFAGVGHFLMLDEMAAIYPPPGAWGGLWWLPGTAKFHVLWSGVLEIVAGLALLASLFTKNRTLAKSAALPLLVMTAAVTPANIYMFTHGAQFPPGKEFSVPRHVIRGVVQMLVLGTLWEVVAPVKDKEERADPK